MEDRERNDLRNAIAIAGAAGTAAMRGVIALCNELYKAESISRNGVDNIERFMLAGLPLAGVSDEAEQVLQTTIQQQFGDLRRRLG